MGFLQGGYREDAEYSGIEKFSKIVIIRTEGDAKLVRERNEDKEGADGYVRK